MGSSPTSSRNSVPPWAASNTPGLDSTAPVNAPRTWPNSSLSKRVSTTAEQLIVTKARPRRGPDWWNARAASSLPLPVSPVRSTTFAGGPHPLTQAERLLHGGAAAEHAAELELARHLAFEGDDVRAAFDLHPDVDEDLTQTIEIERLGEVFARAQLDRFDGAIDRGVRRHQNHFAARDRGPNLAQQVKAVDVRHPQVDHRQVRRFAHQRLHRLAAAPARDDVEAGLPRQALNHLQRGRVVVHDEEQRTGGDRFGRDHGNPIILSRNRP